MGGGRGGAGEGVGSGGGGEEKEEPLSLLVVSKQWPNNSPKWLILFPQLKVSSTCLFQVLTYNQSTINKEQQCHRWKWVVVLIITEGRRRVERGRGKREGGGNQLLAGALSRQQLKNWKQSSAVCLICFSHV